MTNQQENFVASSEPVIFRLNNSEDKKSFDELQKSDSIFRVNDCYREQARELYAIQNPSIYFSKEFDAQEESSFSQSSEKLSELGVWVYFPWLGLLTHILDEEEFMMVRTSRNKHLITTEEQKAFYNLRIGIAGLSVGHSIALALALEGGAKQITIADNDTLELSNTNRILAGIDMLGVSKIDVTKRAIYLLNPYAKIRSFPEGLHSSNISQFCRDLDVIVDEVDNLEVKYELREEAKRRGLPLIMATDNEEGSIIDIERYDVSPAPMPFLGRLGEITHDQLVGLTKQEAGNLIAQYVGVENTTDRMRTSLREIGKTLISWPQVGGTAMLNGALMSYVLRHIAVGKYKKSERMTITKEEVFQILKDEV